MKSLFRLFVVLVVLLTAAAAVVRDSPYWTPYAIGAAVEAGDVVGVEVYVDLERFVASSTAVSGALAKGALGVDGSDVGSRAVAGLVDAIAGGIGNAVAKDGAKELRKAIAQKRLERRIGPFELLPGRDAIGPVSGDSLTVRGTCNGQPAELALTLERRDDGPLGGHPRRYVVVGVDDESARALVRQCNATGATAPKKKGR